MNFWPSVDQCAEVGPHRAKIDPLNQLSRGKRHNDGASGIEGVYVCMTMVNCFFFFYLGCT